MEAVMEKHLHDPARAVVAGIDFMEHLSKNAPEKLEEQQEKTISERQRLESRKADAPIGGEVTPPTGDRSAWAKGRDDLTEGGWLAVLEKQARKAKPAQTETASASQTELKSSRRTRE